MRVARVHVNDNTYQFRDARSEINFENQSAEFARLNGVLQANKALLADKITSLGVTTSPNDSLLKMAENIGLITTGDTKPTDSLIQYTTPRSSVGITYPWIVSFMDGGSISSTDFGALGYKRALDSSNDSDQYIAITRVKTWTNSYYSNGSFPIMNITAFGRFGLGSYNKKLYFRGDNISETTADIVEFFDDDGFFDCYVKVEINIGATGIQYKIYMCKSDEDGQPTDYEFITQTSSTLPTKQDYVSLAFRGSINGIDGLQYTSCSYVNTNFDEHLGWGYSYYIRESCLVAKGSDGIFRVVLGSSTHYVRGDE